MKKNPRKTYKAVHLWAHAAAGGGVVGAGDGAGGLQLDQLHADAQLAGHHLGHL